jgi:hypothetical protein
MPPPLPGTTNWILYNFHPSLSKHHVLKLCVCSGSFGLSLGCDLVIDLVLEQWLLAYGGVKDFFLLR